MKITQKGEYGLHALLELAGRYGEGPLQSALIAERRRVPVAYLQQIMLSLQRAGLVHSERGPRGGHELARPPAEISLLEAIQALEGSTAAAACMEPGAPICAQHDRCVLLPIWREVDEAVQRILSGVSLADLVRREREFGSPLMYYI